MAFDLNNSPLFLAEPLNMAAGQRLTIGKKTLVICMFRSRFIAFARSLVASRLL